MGVLTRHQRCPRSAAEVEKSKIEEIVGASWATLVADEDLQKREEQGRRGGDLEGRDEREKVGRRGEMKDNKNRRRTQQQLSRANRSALRKCVGAIPG